MVDTGDRLSYSIKGKDFSINDNLSGGSIIYAGGSYTSFTIDRKIVLQHLQDLQDALNGYTKKVLWFKKLKPISYNDSLVICEDKHCVWTLGLNGKGAVLDNGAFCYTRGFDVISVLRKINYVYSQVLCAKAALDPKRDIVRRISDVGLLVWVYKEHSIAVYERNVSGCCMTNCLVDGVYYKALLVGSSKELGLATLFTPDFEEVTEFPLDDSILAYYPDVTETLK